MSNEKESPKQRTKPVEIIHNDAVSSAVGSLAAHFLRENKEKGRSLRIPSLGIIIHADGSEEKIDKSG